ncbi:MFS transporter [Nocardioides sp. C4-1]|uniref:MFS transporter n=1 Tax=Nocardioides sp. C4-1 TaxID=3151851 RepID=UPI0032657775
MRRSDLALVLAGTGLIAGTYGLVRLAYGLYLPDVDADLGLGADLGGWTAAGGSVAYCVGAVTGVVASHRPRALVAGAVLTASVGSVAMAVAPGAGLFVPAAVVASTCAGLASPGLVALVARTVEAGRRDRAQAWVNAGTGPGLAAAGALALVLLPHWRPALVVAAASTAAAGIAVLVLDRGTSAAPARASAPLLRQARLLLRPAVAAVLLGAGSAAVWTYGRSHLVREGAGTDGSTLAWVALGLGGTATVLTARRLGRLRAAEAWRVTSVAVAVSIAALALLGGSTVAGVTACAAFGWAYVAASSALITWAGERVADDPAAGTAVLFVALVAGQAAGAALGGAVADAVGLRTVLLGSAAIALTAAAAAGTQRSRWNTSGMPSRSSSRVSSTSIRR